MIRHRAETHRSLAAVLAMKDPWVFWRLRSQDDLSWGKEKLRRWQLRGSTRKNFGSARSGWPLREVRNVVERIRLFLRPATGDIGRERERSRAGTGAQERRATALVNPREVTLPLTRGDLLVHRPSLPNSRE
jgi:hypothetical protein